MKTFALTVALVAALMARNDCDGDSPPHVDAETPVLPAERLPSSDPAYAEGVEEASGHDPARKIVLTLESSVRSDRTHLGPAGACGISRVDVAVDPRPADVRPPYVDLDSDLTIRYVGTGQGNVAVKLDVVERKARYALKGATDAATVKESVDGTRRALVNANERCNGTNTVPAPPARVEELGVRVSPEGAAAGPEDDVLNKAILAVLPAGTVAGSTLHIELLVTYELTVGGGAPRRASYLRTLYADVSAQADGSLGLETFRARPTRERVPR